MTLSSLFAGYSRNEIIASLLFAFVFAALGYRMSHRHRLVRGVTPWRVPSAVWAVICFFLQPFGIIVELVAQATTKPTTAPGGASPMARGSAFPAYPQRAGVAMDQRASTPVALPPVTPDAPVAVPAGPPQPAGDGTGKTPLFGWYTDTTGRHELRYWDGRRWSEHVRDHGVDGSDPV